MHTPTLRKRLLDALDACAVAPVADMEGPCLTPCADENEYASRVVEVDMLLCLRRRMDERRMQIENALKRLDAGEYGECEECGDEIGIARLMANPVARLCVHCQAESERRPVSACA